MMNLETLDWDPEMLEVLGVPRAMLPDIKPSSAVYGYAKNSGLDGIPVAGDLGDQQAALFGQTCYDPRASKTHARLLYADEHRHFSNPIQEWSFDDPWL